MGRIIDSWVATELPKIQMMLQPPNNIGDPGLPQRGGGTTFPMSFRGNGESISATPVPGATPPAPTFGQQPQGSELPANWRAQIPRSPQAQSFADAHGAQPSNAASTFEVPDREQGTMKPEDVNNFDDLVAAAPDQMNSGSEILAQHLGGDEGMDRAYAQATGNAPPKDMTRQQKGQLLMEFGLRVLAHNANGNGDAFGAVGQAGVETLMGHRQRQRDAVKDENEDQDRKLRRDLMEAQTQAAKSSKTQLKADRDGKLRLIDMATGTSRMVLDEDGKPVSAGGDGDDQFVFDLQRNAFEGAFCAGLDGNALAECKKNALLFSKGGSIAELAFPEIRRQKRVDELMRFYADPDNSGVRLRTNGGDLKRWREMTGDEQRDAVLKYVDQFDTNLTQRATGARSAAPARDNRWGLTQEQIDSFPEGKRTTLPNGVILSRRGGKVVQIDEQGNEIQ